MTLQPKRRKRRRLRKEIKYGLLVLSVILSILLIFNVVIPLIDSMRLSSMGYSRQSAKNIVAQKLTKTALSRDYSSAFDVNMANGIVVKDHLELYYVSVHVTDDIIALNDKLIESGYAEEAVLKVIGSLDFKEITPLLLFNNITDMDAYVADVLSNRNQEGFKLTGSYTAYYEGVKDIENVEDMTALVNKYYVADGSYEPSVVTMSVQYASANQFIRNEAYQAFVEMVKAMKQDGVAGIYASSAYRSYAKQESIYASYVTYRGLDWAERFSARAGHSEHQLGLAIDVTSIDQPSVRFETTDEYEWLSNNAHLYGWILRYPKDREIITGYDYEPWHYRYLGVDLATEVHQSGLTYDEYYELYLRGSAE